MTATSSISRCFLSRKTVAGRNSLECTQRIIKQRKSTEILITTHNYIERDIANVLHKIVHYPSCYKQARSEPRTVLVEGQSVVSH